MQLNIYVYFDMYNLISPLFFPWNPLPSNPHPYRIPILSLVCLIIYNETKSVRKRLGIHKIKMSWVVYKSSLTT